MLELHGTNGKRSTRREIFASKAELGKNTNILSISYIILNTMLLLIPPSQHNYMNLILLLSIIVLVTVLML